MDQRRIPTTDSNGASTVRELFALTDEQILEIEPEAQDVAGARYPWPLIREENAHEQAQARRASPAVISSEARNLSSSDMADEAARSKRDSSSPSAPRNGGTGQSAPDAAATSHKSRFCRAAGVARGADEGSLARGRSTGVVEWHPTGEAGSGGVSRGVCDTRRCACVEGIVSRRRE